MYITKYNPDIAHSSSVTHDSSDKAENNSNITLYFSDLTQYSLDITENN